MAEPQPANVHEGAEQPDVVPANAEDRKAAAALSALDIKGDEEASAPKKDINMKALGEALKSLDSSQKAKKTTETTKKEEATKKLIKVDPIDVALLVDNLELSKTKATDLLRAHDANVMKAMSAWLQSA